MKEWLINSGVAACTKHFVGRVYARHVSIALLFHDKMSVGQISVSQMSVDQMSVRQMYIL
jgi:hypothetical protein